MQNQLTPQKYILTKGRNLQFGECYISQNWKKSGMATIVLAKIMPSGNYIFATYLVDIFCLGIKDTSYKFNISKVEFHELLEKFNSRNIVLECEIATIHNIIYGAIDYAAELGFKPCKEFELTEHLLNPDLIDDGIDEIEFGKNGMPLYISGPFDNIKRIIATLDQSVGEGNYHYITGNDENFE